MAQKTIYAVANGNWNAANNWADASDGSGSTYTNPQNGADTYICDLNGKNITVNVAVSVDKIRTGATIAGGTLVIPDGATASITVTTATSGIYSNYSGSLITWTAITTASSLTINGDAQYASTSYSGMLTSPSKATLTINGKLTVSGTAYAVYATGTGVVNVSNAGNTAVNATNGYALSHNSTGALTITGALTAAGGRCIYLSNNATVSITGDVSNTGSNPAILTSAGTTTIVGNLSSTVASVVQLSGGTVNWIGARTCASDCFIEIYAGTLAFATAGGALTLTCSAPFVIWKIGGTLTMTSGANTASIIRNTAAAQPACLGQDISAYITGPTLPSAGDVDDAAADFGYAGSLLIPTCKLPTVDKVEDGYFYGADGVQFEGELAVGGGDVATIPVFGGHVTRRV